MYFVVRLLCCDDIRLEHNPAGTLYRLMQTDPTEAGEFHLLLTEGLPRYGTRRARAKTNPRLRELI
jgi:hypothetical protein